MTYFIDKNAQRAEALIVTKNGRQGIGECENR
jgi:hypothetical protein